MTAFLVSSPAAAQVGAAVSIFSDARFRGYSLSAGRPAAFLDISYDDSSGAYAAVSTSVVASSNGLHPLALQLNGGYAKRLPSGLTLDLGIANSYYSRYSSAYPGKSYTEIYAGLSGKLISSRLYFSPHYFGDGERTLYGELDGAISPASSLSLEGHVGLLVPLHHSGYGENSRTEYDWRLGVTRTVGPIGLHAAWSGGGPGRDYYREHDHSRNVLTFGLSYAL